MTSFATGWLIKRSDTKEYWCGGDDWSFNPVNAKRFGSFDEAFEGSPKGVLFRVEEHSFHVTNSVSAPQGSEPK